VQYPTVVEVRFAAVEGDQALRDWRHVHNAVVPTDPLSLEDVRERAGRHHLELAYAGTEVVGNSTVRRPTEDEGAVVIARVLPPYRRRGIGTALYERGLAVARAWADERPVETVVLESSSDGLAFAEAVGFVEVERYTLPGATLAYVALALR
jgi:GNAT superfamily N-acetyltransferase